MKRRQFLKRTVLLTAGCSVLQDWKTWANPVEGNIQKKELYYDDFVNPMPLFRPFVRWWWNG
ncbi:MAG: hypothetical protein IJD84_08940, partial [Parabacteroides sp.]|nr:hypothetical protein [Parabacteroides sp.]